MSASANKVWRWPLWIGAITATGLLSALIGDGAYDALSWCLLAIPLLVIAWALSQDAAD